MDTTGVRTLRERIEQQEHWRSAAAVARGDQPATDPDAWDLEELAEGLRLYATREEHRELVDGQPALVIHRLTKRLVDGRWQTVYAVERTRFL
jgi:hypothetical protein